MNSPFALHLFNALLTIPLSHYLIHTTHSSTRNCHSRLCRDPFPWETRGTQLIVMRGTCYQPDLHHPDSPEDMHGAVILSGPPQGKANDVSASPIQGRANDAGRA